MRRTLALFFGLIIAVGLLVVGSGPSSAAVVALNSSSAPFGIPCQWLLETSDVPTDCAREAAEKSRAVSETRARLVASGASAANDKRILGTLPRIGDVAAPVRRFRDGGHAYYLFGRGLHSCTYTGKCMDLFAPIGEPVYAFAGGRLTRKEYAAGSYGHYLEIRLADKSVTLYAHLQKIVAKNGPVKAGDLIGYVGCSGTSGEFSGCNSAEEHLHFEWSALKWKSGEYGQLPPFFSQWRGTPRKCYHGC